MKMFTRILLVSFLCTVASAAEPGFVKVAPDHWSFAYQATDARFTPVGANFIIPDTKSEGGWALNILTQSAWDPELIKRAFAAAKGVNLNIMKVFLPSHQALPDPQPLDGARFGDMQPPLMERLDFLFGVAKENEIYISLTFAEWGSHALKWWQEGGEFMGRDQEPVCEANSFAVLRGFWEQLAQRYANEPMLFSYNLAVEYYAPGGNWGGQKSEDPEEAFLFKDRWGLPAWHGWLGRHYPSVDAVNKAWGTQYAKVEDIEQPEFGWENGHYTKPQAMIADYNSFREYVAYQFFKNQVKAIKKYDTRHMITAGLHPHHPAVGWSGSAKHLAALTPAEMDFFDYTTVHVYTNTLDMKPGVSADRIQRAELETRFAHAGKPVMVEEMGHITKDRKETVSETISLVKRLRPHASGFMLWFLADPDKDSPYGLLNPDLSENEFGTAWKDLVKAGNLLSSAPEPRVPPATVFNLDRLQAMAPEAPTEAQKVIQNWESVKQPVDFVVKHNPSLK
jgi:hypothetical protein